MSVQKLLAALEPVFLSWAESKLAFEQSVPVGDAWIHLIVGPVIFLLSALVMRKPISSWHPWFVVLALTMLNEIIDLVVGIWPRRTPRYGDTVSDFLLTMAIPTLLLVLARYSAGRKRRHAKGGPLRTEP